MDDRRRTTNRPGTEDGRPEEQLALFDPVFCLRTSVGRLPSAAWFSSRRRADRPRDRPAACVSCVSSVTKP